MIGLTEEPYSQHQTVTAWADIVVRVWEEKIQRLGVYQTQGLLNSFYNHVQGAANGRADYVKFAFNYYGRFADMGVGKGTPMGSMSFTRKAKPWYSKTFFWQVTKLSQILAKKYAQEGAIRVVQNIDDKALGL